jgi:dipeptidyl aminopeptidase/acylaminoacyl peptidase
MMAEEFQRNKVEHRLITFPKAEHGLAGLDAAKIEVAYSTAVEFMRKHLGRPIANEETQSGPR